MNVLRAQVLFAHIHLSIDGSRCSELREYALSSMVMNISPSRIFIPLHSRLIKMGVFENSRL